VPCSNRLDGASVERKRVCGDCAGGAFVLVLRAIAPECLCCHAPAVVCRGHGDPGDGVHKASIARLAKKLRGVAMAYLNNSRGDDDDNAIRAAALEQAAAIVERDDA
jgi:hypothetical protein